MQTSAAIPGLPLADAPRALPRLYVLQVALGRIDCVMCAMALLLVVVAGVEVGAPRLALGVFVPLAGAAGLLLSIRKGRGALRLVRQGRLARAQLVQKERTGWQVNRREVLRLTFRFVDERGRARDHEVTTSETSDLLDHEEELLLYDPAPGGPAVLLDEVPGRPRILGDRIVTGEHGSLLKAFATLGFAALAIALMLQPGALPF